MNRDTMVATLRRHRQDLQGLGVEGSALFGSMARGDGDAASDIDLAATYDEAVVKDLLDMGGVAAAIESYLGSDNFDLADERRLHPHLRDAFMSEHVRIF